MQEQLLDLMRNVKGVSEKTRKTYVSSLERLIMHVKMKKGLIGVITSPDSVVRILDASSLSLQTQRAYIAAVVALFKHVPDDVLASLLPASTLEALRKRWVILLRERTEEAFTKYGTMAASKHQRDNYIPWEDWILTRDAMIHKAKVAPLTDVAVRDAALLLAMLTYIPPVRADFNMVKIVNESDKTDETPNRIIVHQDGGMTLQLTEFKTAGPKFKMIVSPFPKELVDVVKSAMDARRELWTMPGPRFVRVQKQNVQPWTWLFVSPISGRPYQDADVGSDYMRKLLRQAFGGNKRVGFNLARHAFINGLDFNKLSTNEMRSIAMRMGHSIEQQLQYRLLNVG